MNTVPSSGSCRRVRLRHSCASTACLAGYVSSALTLLDLLVNDMIAWFSYGVEKLARALIYVTEETNDLSYSLRFGS
jgi:hypothetical protein